MLIINIEGDQQVSFTIDTLSEKVFDLTPVWEKIAKDLIEWESEIFETEGAAIGRKWAPLSPKTIKQKQRKGYPLKPLIRTGRLMASLTQAGHSDMVLIIDNFSLTFGSARLVERGDWFLAPIHHYGAPSRNIPARALMPDESQVSQRFRDKWLSIFEDYLREE
ncbi:MAG: phage virion morphogenesis protein [Armatimonadota bacterium]|nr:phage virion morphogenesis protein [Armatimonadota bacterium]MDW8143960.1 phage virion morphogenesis protein [Armatimonadota bacterium]